MSIKNIEIDGSVRVKFGKLAGKRGQVTKLEARHVTVRIGGASIVLDRSAVEAI